MPIYASFAVLALLFLLGVPVFAAFFGFNIFAALLLMGPQMLSIFPASILDTSMTSELVTVPLFILLGELLFRSGCITILFDAVDDIIGGIRGRQYVIVVVISVLLGALSGSAIAVAAMLGRTVMAEGIQRGGDKQLLAGLVLGGACLAPIIPPSFLIVLIGMLSGTSISSLLAAGVLPGIVAGVLFFLYVQVLLWRDPSRDIERPSDAPRGSMLRAILSLLPFSIVIFAVLGLILLGIATPNESAACGVFGALVVAAIYRRLSLSMVIEALKGTVLMSSMILLIMAASKILTQLMAFSGLTADLVALLTGLDLPPVVVLAILMLIPFVLCMFLDQIALMLVLIPIYVPLLATFGFDPLVVWTLFLLNLTLGSITPPFGYALFALSASSPKDVSLREIYAASWPFIGLIVLTLILVWAFPPLATWLPSRL
ncbi:TRAP transporter large permease [Paracoccus zhejiangensis]|uniref:C4-dicarboxylate ABC transporter permease n=1 Tax=Paracoccus zhejiangensis TaxID=1077935 RepID=A0A2H5F159_9RHOB|nr:TRAP transporter large permease [Paracoccus zhejiangensis]AUH65267.1 C4-dicarboxylate ABC transporter permease [Paracoccus zhejiangensis]